MKKSLLVLAAAVSLACLSLAGCTTAKIVTSTEVSSKATVLGPVVLKTNYFSYTKLLNEAQKKYPEAQDVVHIQVDGRKYFGRAFVVYGIAVSY